MKIAYLDSLLLCKSKKLYYQQSPLHAAAENGHSEVCTILLVNQADKNQRENNFG